MNYPNPPFAMANNTDASAGVTKPPVVQFPPNTNAFYAEYDASANKWKYRALVGAKRKYKKESPWMKIYQESAAWLAKQRLTGEQATIFFYLSSHLDWENYVSVNQKEVAEELGMKQQNVARALKKLMELSVIEEGPRAGLHKTYMLNPYMGLKGENGKEKVLLFNDWRIKRRNKKILASRARKAKAGQANTKQSE